jgi:hypothetical protein
MGRISRKMGARRPSIHQNSHLQKVLQRAGAERHGGREFATHASRTLAMMSVAEQRILGAAIQ